MPDIAPQQAGVTRFAHALDRSFKGVRVAWFKDLGGMPFDPRVRTVVEGHRTTFESLGCIVEQAEQTSPPPRSPFACCAPGIRRILMARACMSIQTLSRTRSRVRSRKGCD